MSLTRKDWDDLYPRLMGYAVSLCKSQTLAADLVSDTFIKAAENLDKGLEPVDLTAWCITVLKNRYLDTVKKKKESQLNPERPEDELLQDGSVGTDAFSRLLYNECMDQLKPIYREVIIKSIFGNMTAKIIAEAMNKPQNTILTWLSKAKIEFHDCITGKA